jgi:rhomboid protease GluP
LIIAINVIVFVLAERVGSTTEVPTLIRFGADWRGLVWAGEYWRLFTSMFLHIGVIHLLWNAYGGFRISASVEPMIGHWWFLSLYVLSGIAGAAVSVIGHDAVAAGASGALFGVIGCELVVAREHAGSFRAMLDDPERRSDMITIALWFVVGVFAGFDNYAHAGGLAFGLLFTWALLAQPPRRRARLAIALVSFAALVSLSLRPLPLIHSDDYAVMKAYRVQSDPAAVLALTEPMLGSAKRIDALRVRAPALLKLGRYQDAIDTATEVLAHHPDDQAAYVTRGGARWMVGDAAGAELDFARGIELDSTSWARDTVAYYRSQAPVRDAAEK